MFGVTHHACEQAGELLTVDFELIQEEMEQVNALDSDNRVGPDPSKVFLKSH